MIRVGGKKHDDSDRDNARYRVLANTFSQNLRIDRFARYSRGIADKTSLPVDGEGSFILRTTTRNAVDKHTNDSPP